MKEGEGAEEGEEVEEREEEGVKEEEEGVLCADSMNLQLVQPYSRFQSLQVLKSNSTSFL